MKPIRRANLYFLAALITQLSVVWAVPYLTPIFRHLPYSIAFYTAITQLLCFLPPFLAYMLLAKPAPVTGFRRISVTNLVLTVLMCLTILPAMAALSAVTSMFFDNPVSGYMGALLAFPLPVMLFVMAVIPAFLEELALRGVVLENYGSLPIKRAALINGLFFGMLHLNLQQFLYAMMMGILFSYLVYYTKSLWASVIGHFTVNATQVLLARLSLDALASETVQTPTTTELLYTLLALAVVTAIFLPVFLILFNTFVSHNKRRLFLDAMNYTLAESQAECAQTPVNGSVPADGLPDWAFVCAVMIYALFIMYYTL